MRLRPVPVVSKGSSVVLSEAKDLPPAPQNAFGTSAESASLRTTERALGTTRRGALSLLAAPALSLLARPVHAADLDVIIIGAGVAGFTAANALIGARKNVVVLEARERTGGRVFTNTSIGLPFDEGAPTRPGSGSALVLIGGHELSRAEYARYAKVSAELEHMLETLRTQLPGVDPRLAIQGNDPLEKLAIAELFRRAPFAPFATLPVTRPGCRCGSARG